MGSKESRPGRLGLLLIGVAAALMPLKASAGWVSGPTLRLRLEGRYDSNLAEGGGDGSSLVQPGVGWKLASPTTTIDALYLFEVVSFAHQGAGRGGVNHRVRGDQHFELDKRSTLELHQAFEQVYDPTSLSRIGVVRTAGRTSYAEADLGFNRRLGHTWNIGVRLQEEYARIDTPSDPGLPRPDASDSAVHSPSAWLSHSWSTRDASTLRYRLQYFQAIGGLDAASNEVSLSYAHDFTKTVRMELEVGPAWYTMNGTTSTVPWGRWELNQIWQRVTLGLKYERGLFGSTGFEGALWGDAISGVANWRVSEPLRATVAVAAFRNGAAPDRSAFVGGFGGAAVLEYALGGDVAAQFAWRRVEQWTLSGAGLSAIDISRNVFAAGFFWQLDGGRLPR
ncbi:hypothetical protein [Vulgatibacter incomptus]|uniref:Uncharacterized protein n=1 Tax=Vulgatibacter incomptus TaxID=1391653 RepID=A0A0K1PC13_9BACT|nr:hypothetical protein [Vulgatibacter incomptus]AKU90654.1 hypothetical protein AKJ08_1041 [Vulgatibacter incomptus]